MEGIMCFSVSGTMRQMSVGEKKVFCADNSEITIRNAATRLKGEGAGEWSVKKMANRLGFEVTRIA